MPEVIWLDKTCSVNGMMIWFEIACIGQLPDTSGK